MLDDLVAYARAIRDIRRAAPTNVEQALAPAFQALLQAVLPQIAPGAGLTVVGEWTKAGIGRPDIALTRPGQPPRAFIELKAPTKPVNPAQFTDAHDKRQFLAFKALPDWAISNFCGLRVYHRGDQTAEVQIVPEAAIAPTTSDAKAEALVRKAGCAALAAALLPLALASPPAAANARELAGNLAHAARLVRALVAERLAELVADGVTDSPLQAVRDEFREILYAHPQAGGYASGDFNTLFAAAFAQTLAFGLLLVREATGKPVDSNSWQHMPPEHPLMRTTLRVLSQEEILADITVGFTVIIDTINSFDAALIARQPGKPDPILYFYEDFLMVFDPVAREKYGVYYTPVEVVDYMVSALDRGLRDHLHLAGLGDSAVTVLDPATGTGTFLLGIVERVRAEVEAASPGKVKGALRDLAGRLYGLELLVGPYAVAHYRLHHALGGLAANERVGVYLADTLSEPGAAAPAGRLGFVAENIRTERLEADEIKAKKPILAIIGNPPYKRLADGETDELVGNWMDALWDDLKAPVRDAGWANQLNTFPELSVAFWRWAVWKMFESAGAPGRGVIALITNRTFLAGKPYAGLRRMLRQRFDRIEVVDLRGDLRRGARAGVVGDGGVFNIQVGTAITLAIADGSKAAGALAEVHYADMWKMGLFDRKAKLTALTARADKGLAFDSVIIAREGLADWKPDPFKSEGAVSLASCFSYRVSGIQTKRDHLAYGFAAVHPFKHANWETPSDRAELTAQAKHLVGKIGGFLKAQDEQASDLFHDSRDRKWGAAQAHELDGARIRSVAYRPFDLRHFYNHPAYADFPRPELQSVWGSENVCLYAMPFATGEGPAVWCHGFLPDYHAFRGSYGGYAFPLHDRRPGRTHNLDPALLAGLALAYGRAVTPAETFDAILALLSATRYSRRFAEDLEDVFPHVPFPAERAVFDAAATLGAQIRSLQSFTRPPAAIFAGDAAAGVAAIARIETTPEAALDAGDWHDGGFSLCHHATAPSGRVGNVPQAVWDFAVSGYRVLPRWLAHRKGQPCDKALLDEVEDLARRIAELLTLFDAADAILDAAVAKSLTLAQLGLASAAAIPDSAGDGQPA